MDFQQPGVCEVSTSIDEINPVFLNEVRIFFLSCLDNLPGFIRIKLVPDLTSVITYPLLIFN